MSIWQTLRPPKSVVTNATPSDAIPLDWQEQMLSHGPAQYGWRCISGVVSPSERPVCLTVDVATASQYERIEATLRAAHFPFDLTIVKKHA